MLTVSIWNQITTEFFGNVAAARAWPSTHIACLAVYNCRSRNLCLCKTVWWRTQSQSNLSQQQNSLLTGKITGNFAGSGLNPQFWWRVS